MCAMALPAIAVVSVIPDRVIGLFYNSEYADAIVVLQVLIWVLLLDFLNPFLSHVLFAQGKQHKSMRVAGISLVVNVVATLILVFRFGAMGAAAGTVIGGLVATCFYLFAAMPKHDVIATFSLAFRVALASIGMGVAIYLFRQSDWFILIGIGILSYVPLLFAVRAIRPEDVRMFKKTFLIKAT
jgi:O-antigen/teichoic acid export membrane protein